jgi:hypothetical protein
LSNPYWIHPETYTTLSPINGHGRFTRVQIFADEIVMVIGGRILDSRVEKWSTGIPLHENLIIQADDDFKNNGVVNHSCKPNLELRGDICLYAKRQISAEEELTVDYGSFLHRLGQAPKVFIETCTCRSDSCRSQVTSDDWKALAQQGERISSFLTLQLDTLT